MKQERLKKMNSLLKEIVGNSLFMLTSEIQSDFGIIAVNKVDLTSDLSYLDIYVSCIKNQDILCKTLAKFAQEIKVDINKKNILRIMPIIRFKYLDEIEFTNKLINKINLLEK